MFLSFENPRIKGQVKNPRKIQFGFSKHQKHSFLKIDTQLNRSVCLFFGLQLRRKNDKGHIDIDTLGFPQTAIENCK